MLDAARQIVSFTQTRLKDDHPLIMWKPIGATRDRLVHGYYDVDVNIVWGIITQNLPPLIAALEKIIQSEES
jgi:uncharacterized protein with HEPN domain